MFNFSYEFNRDGEILIFRVTGFTTYSKFHPVLEAITMEIKALEEKKLPYKLLFDIRGLMALDPRTVELIKEFDKTIYESSVIKVGLVMDKIITKLQQLRVANEYPMDNAKYFSDYDECLAWLKE